MTNVLLTAFAAATLPMMTTSAMKSGLNPGEMVTPFHPQHVAGPNKGTDACPPCTYGNLPQVQAWINNDDEANVIGLQNALAKEVKMHSGHKLKAFVINMTSCEMCVEKTNKWAMKWDENVALAHISNSDKAVTAYKINKDSSVKNTIIVYKDRKVVANFVNWKADKDGMASLSKAIQAATK